MSCKKRQTTLLKQDIKFSQRVIFRVFPNLCIVNNLISNLCIISTRITSWGCIHIFLYKC